jgi:exopolyphosphatase/guanosine-5'-triphosphate,3'-diphosphate pyrophosphatase
MARDGKGHHKESARLIREAVWTGFRADEVAVLAQIARYHRKSLPSEEHGDFMALGAEERERVRRLAALLRVADGLDRQHLQKVTEIRAEPAAGQVTVLVVGAGLAEELAAARKKADLAEQVFGRRWVFAAV